MKLTLGWEPAFSQIHDLRHIKL